MPAPTSPLQFGRGAFTPTGLAINTPQRATSTPGGLAAAADKMWKSPAAQPARVPKATPGKAPATKLANGGLLPTSPLGQMPGAIPPAPPPAAPRMPTPAQPAKPVAPAGPAAAPAPQPAPSAPAGPQGGGGLLSGLQGMFSNPAATGALLNLNPQFTAGLTGATGGLGLMALVNLIQNGGRDIAQFLPGANASGGTGGGA